VRGDGWPVESTLWALDELERVLGGATLYSCPGPGGEWDAVKLWSRRDRRRLVGARHMTRDGWQPDQLAEMIRDEVPGIDSTDAAMSWFKRTALAAIGEARVLAHRRRHLRLALREGHISYYAYRTMLARAKGYGSLWYERKGRGWS
jgi:hypothetical protein